MPAFSSPFAAAALAVVLIIPATQPPLVRTQFPPIPEERTSSLGLTRLLGVAPVPGASRFVAAQHFRESVAREARVKVLWIGRNFRQHFLGKTEVNVRPTEIGIHRLRRSARDPSIIAGIGERHETRLAHVWWMLSRQPNGQTGALALHGVPNVFYVRAVDGTLWAIDVVWSGAGWEIGASAIDDPRPWGAGRQIMSR